MFLLLFRLGRLQLGLLLFILCRFDGKLFTRLVFVCFNLVHSLFEGLFIFLDVVNLTIREQLHRLNDFLNLEGLFIALRDSSTNPELIVAPRLRHLLRA